MVSTKPTSKANKVKSGKDDKTSDETFDSLRVDAKLANTAVLMLDSPEEDVLQKALQSIFKFCEKSDNNKLIVHELGATEKIFNLISHEERVVQRNATMALGLLSSHADVRRWCKHNSFVFEKILTLLRVDFDQLTNEFAAMWVRNMCEDYSVKSFVASNQEAIGNLVAMLTFPDPDAVFNALGALNKICDDFDARGIIGGELKGVEPILKLMNSEFPQIQEAVFSSLTKLTHNAECREAMRELNGLEQIVEFLSNSDQKRMQVSCLNLLSNCLEDIQSLEVIQHNGCLNKLLAFCQELNEDPDSSMINSAAARALAKGSKKLENRKILHEQNAEKTLIYLLLNDNDETRAEAAHALAVMAESSFCQEAIRNNDGIEVLVRLLTSENSRVRQYACLALANLTYNNSINCRCLLSAQGIEPLINLLKDENDKTKAMASVCLINMASDQAIREEVELFTFTPSLAACLTSKNPFTQAKACFLIASYSVDQLFRSELKSSGILQLIVDLTKSNDSEVRRSACWAITSSAADLNVAVEFCRHGAIEVLRDMNLSAQRKSGFTESAFKKLLEVNLSAKYAFKNMLDPTDFIYDCFYDMGPMRPNGKFHSLDELSVMPVNDKRPIIIVYAPDDKSKKSGSDSKKHSNEELSKTPVNPHPNPDDSIKSDRSKEKVHTLGMDVFKPVFDKDLKLWIDQARDLFPNLPIKDQITNLAKFVSEKLGGRVSRAEVNNLGYDLLINEIKYDLKSNIVPIGKIRLGTFYHRALLFKIFADRLNLKVSLERGDYNRAWNVVSLKNEKATSYSIKQYIVDLMYEPGKLLDLDSLEGIQYTKF